MLELVRRIGSAGLGRSRGYGVNVIIENLSRACCRNGAGRTLRVVASIAVAAISLVAPAAAYGVVSEQAEQNITFSIPTSLSCAVRADGTVIAPSGWSMSNSGSGKVEITGVSVSNAIGKLKLSGKSGSIGYAVGEGSGSYTVSYDEASGCKFSSTSNRSLGIESGKTISWNWNIGKLNASDHRAALDSAASGRARLCDMSFSYASVGNSLSAEGTTGSMSGAVNSQSSSVLPVGGTATANVGNAPSNATLSYQWYTIDSNGSYSAIANANGKTLKVLAAYRGKDIVCRVSDSSGHYSGYVETARKPVRNLAPKVDISGSAVYGGKLTASTSGLPSGATYTYKYKWQRLSGSSWVDIANATAAEYTLGSEDVGKQVRVVVSTASNIYTVDDVSAISATVAKAKASINVSISGTKNNSSRLTASVSGLPTSGANTVSYRWQRSSDGKSNWVDSTASDAKSNSIQMQPNDVSWHYRCIVSASNPYYDIASATSAAYGPIAKSTVSAARATISGNAVYGGTIKANVTNVPTVGTNSISYQWQYSEDGKAWNDTRLDGGTTSSVTLSAVSCVGTQYRCVISVDNSYYIVPGCTTDGVKVGKASATVNAAISGTAAVGGKLTCSVSGLPTSGSNTVSYQWQYSNDNRTWTNSTTSDAKTATHALNYKEAYNLHWRCSVSVSNPYYSVPTAYTDSRLCGKGTASITASISGNAVIGGKLTCSVGGLPSIGTNSVRYKWQYSSDGNAWTNSTNANASSNSITLQPDAATLGKYFRCVVSATNDVYNGMSATSAASAKVGKGSHSAPSVSISGAKVYGSTLTASVSGQPSGTTGTTYQWQRADAANGTYANIANATGRTYSVGTADMNKYLRVLVNTANTYYNVSQGVSAGYGPIGKASKTISASVSGTKNNTSRLTVSVSGLPTVGTNTVSYQWQYSNNGSTGWRDSTYSDGQSNAIQMKEADVAYYYRCVVSVSGNAYYNVTGATTAAYGPMAKSSYGAPTVSVSGSKTYGSTLTANVSGQPNGTTATSYQWQRADAANGTYANISNATGNTYSVGTADMNKYLRVLVGTTSTYYTVPQGVSDAYGPIGKATTTITATVSGTKAVGSELTVYVGGLPSVGTNTIVYKWQYSGDNKTWTDSNAADAKSNSITTDTTWLNKYARCVITVSGNAYYNVNGATSAAYGPIGKGSHSAPSVSVSGDKAVGATLTASVSGQPDGTTSTTYQWQRAIIANGLYLDISGATGKTYKTVDADKNKYVRVLVNTVNTYYTVSQGVSDGYGAITFEAFAVYSADDNSLDFYKRGIPTVGETFNGKTATAVYTGIEKNSYNYNNVPWKEYRSNIVTSTIVDDIAPVSTANWFNNCSKLTSIDLSKCNTSKATSMTNMFNNCHKLEKVALGENWKWVGTDGFLPAPDPQYIPEASGKWYAGRTAYNPADIPSNKADTYYAYILTTGEANLNYTDDEQATLKCTYTTNKEITPVYQWYRDGKRIDGATKDVYKLTEVDCGKNIECHVSDDNQELKGYLSGNKNIPVLKTVNLDANGGKFSDGSTKHTIKYIQDSELVIKYSHTDNIDNEGNATGTYKANLSTNDVVTIPGATKLTIDVWHATGLKLHDWLAIYPKGITPSSLNYLKATISNGKLGGSFATEKDSATHDTFEVNDDTAQFYFKSNIISEYYGYYAVVKGDCQVNKIISGSNETYIPNYTYYRFDSWNTSIDGRGDKIDNILGNEDNTTLYAKYEDMRSAFAVYCENDKSLNFYKRMNIPSVGDTFNGRAVTAVYTGIEKNSYNHNGIPWKQYTDDILTSTIVDDNITPISTAYWFFTCQNLTSVNNLNKLNTSKVTDMRCMFDDCYRLTSVGDLSGWDTSSVTNMREMFAGDFKLTSVGDLSGWDTSRVTDMSFVFGNCGKLVSIGNISGWNTSGVKSMTYMFNGCSSLTSLDLSGWNTSGVTNMSYMFINCDKLTSVGDLSKWDTSNVTNMVAMFGYCSKLSLNCSNWNVSKVTKNTNFNTNAPGVIAPAWPSSDEIVDEDPIAPQSNELLEENQSKENTKQEKPNNVLTEQNSQTNNAIDNSNNLNNTSDTDNQTGDINTKSENVYEHHQAA